MYMPINPLGYYCIKKLQRDNLLHAYNEPINIYSVCSKRQYWYGTLAFNRRAVRATRRTVWASWASVPY